MTKAKTSLPTQVVLDAQRKYPTLVESVKGYFGDVPYMKERLDYRARDKILLQLTPDDMTNLARSNPAAAEAAAKRISELESKAPPLPPGQGEFEP